MNNEFRLYEKGVEQYPPGAILLNNLVMVVWILLGTVACWLVNPLVAWMFLALAVLMIYVVLRKLVCTNCYYYDRWCHMGWGKLSALMFKKGDPQKFSTSAGIKMAPFVYGALTVIPIILLLISMVTNFTQLKLTLLILILAVGFYSGTISRKKTCANCKMRLVCPGSAVR